MSKKRKSTLFETFFDGNMTLSTGEFFKQLEASGVMACELVSSLRPLALNRTQLTDLQRTLERRNAAATNGVKIELEFAARVAWSDKTTPIPILEFTFKVSGDDTLDAFAIHDLIDDLAPFFIRRSGPTDLRDYLKTKYAETKIQKTQK